MMNGVMRREIFLTTRVSSAASSCGWTMVVLILVSYLALSSVPGAWSYLMVILLRRQIDTAPRLRCPVARLKGVDRLLLAQRQADHIEPLHQHLLLARGQREPIVLSRRRQHDLVLHVDRYVLVAAVLEFGDERLDLFRRQCDKQQTVVGRVEVKDLAVARRDHRFETSLLQAPYRVLAARSAAEVRTADQDFRALVFGAVQHEILAHMAIRIEAQVVQQAAREPRFVDAEQKLLRHDLVGIE